MYQKAQYDHHTKQKKNTCGKDFSFALADWSAAANFIEK